MVSDLDSLMRSTAFDRVRSLHAVNGQLTSSDLRAGFMFDGQRIPWVNPQRGIFKPRSMRFLLSIRTVFPKPGGRVWYDDQRTAHRQIFDSGDSIEYAFQGDDPAHHDNQWLRDASLARVPIIYFVGVSPGRYLAVAPAFIEAWDSAALKVRVAFGESVATTTDIREPDGPSRRYALRAVQQRLHQATFRSAVIHAYGQRCALSGLPEPLLLDAAHIISDRNEQLGQPVVPNGIPLSKIHHAAFDAHLIGIDPDYRMRVSDRLLSQQDGPMLEALKLLQGQLIRLPRRRQDLPDRDRLAIRFEAFKAAA